MLVPKEVIPGPGLYWYLDEATGLPRKIRFTAEGIKHLLDEGTRMLAAGLSIPVPLEHQPGAVPLSTADRAAANLKNNAGWVNRFEMKGDALWSLIDIQDPEVAKKLPRTIRWTSPWITSFMDGAGRPWQGVIGHLALTTRPRIVPQQPFGSIAAAMSYGSTLQEITFAPSTVAQTLAKGRGLPLSRAGLLLGEGTALHPAYPLAFSLYSGGIPLAAAELQEVQKKEKEKPPKSPPKDDHKGDTPPKPGGTELPPMDPAQPGGAPGMPGMEPSLVDSDGDIPVHEVIGDLLETMGVLLEEGATSENFLEKLYKAVMAKMKEGGHNPGADMNVDPKNMGNQPPGGGNRNDLPPNPPVVQEQPPLYMSLADCRERAKSVADPAVRQLLEATLSMQEAEQKKSAALAANTLAAAKAVRDRRVEAICRRNPSPAFRDKVLAIAGGATLSIGDDGSVRDSAAPALEAIEAGLMNLPDLLLSQRGLTQHDHPRDSHPGEISDQRLEAVFDEFSRTVHLPNGSK